MNRRGPRCRWTSGSARGESGEKPAACERARGGRRSQRGRNERETARIAHSAVGSHGCAAYLHLLSPLSSLLHHRRSGSPPHSTPVVVPPRTPVCSSFDFSLSFSLRPSLALPLSRCLGHTHGVDPSLLSSIQRFAFFSSTSSSSHPLPFSLSLLLCSTRVSSRTTGRSCNLGARIYTRINHRGKRSRGERGSKRARESGRM